MVDVKKVLAVVSDRDDAGAVIDKSLTIARNAGAEMHVIKVYYDPFIELSALDANLAIELKSSRIQHQLETIQALVDETAPGEASCDIVWHKHEFQGILDTASEIKADLIVKAVSHEEPRIIRTPEDWNLLRHAEIPVLLVKPIAWHSHPAIVAALDVEHDGHQELNLRIVYQANQLTQCLRGDLHLICAYPASEHWVGPITEALGFERVSEEIESSIHGKLKALAEQQNLVVKEIQAKEGKPEDAIQQLVDEQHDEILVIGTAQRDGVRGLVIGNTSEAILQSVHADGLV